MTAKDKDAAEAPKRSRKKRRGPRWRRWLTGLGVPILVIGGIVVLSIYTQITLTFEGRLWTLPARIYSAPLHVEPRQSLDPEALVARLSRCGYGRVDVVPARPGQYRRRRG